MSMLSISVYGVFQDPAVAIVGPNTQAEHVEVEIVRVLRFRVEIYA